MQNKEMVNAMGQARDALQVEMKKADIDAVDDVVADLEEAMAEQNEISDVLANPIGQDDMDEDDLMDELQDLEDEIDAEEAMKDDLAELDLPDAGKGQINVPAKE